MSCSFPVTRLGKPWFPLDDRSQPVGSWLTAPRWTQLTRVFTPHRGGGWGWGWGGITTVVTSVTQRCESMGTHETNLCVYLWTHVHVDLGMFSCFFLFLCVHNCHLWCPFNTVPCALYVVLSTFLYVYCFLLHFSDLDRMRFAIGNLFNTPQNNFRLFKVGRCYCLYILCNIFIFKIKIIF